LEISQILTDSADLESLNLKLDEDMPKKSSNKAKSQRSRERALLQKVHLNAAGIDIGADVA
jgi:hypothetical protein